MHFSTRKKQLQNKSYRHDLVNEAVHTFIEVTEELRDGLGTDQTKSEQNPTWITESNLPGHISKNIMISHLPLLDVQMSVLLSLLCSLNPSQIILIMKFNSLLGQSLYTQQLFNYNKQVKLLTYIFVCIIQLI